MQQGRSKRRTSRHCRGLSRSRGSRWMRLRRQSPQRFWNPAFSPLCSSPDWHSGTFMGTAHKVALWLMGRPPGHLPPPAPCSPQPWFIRLVPVTWHRLCPLFLLHVETPHGHIQPLFGVPTGGTHQTETRTRAHTPHTHTWTRLWAGVASWKAGEPPTAATLKGSLTQRAQLLAGPQG